MRARNRLDNQTGAASANGRGVSCLTSVRVAMRQALTVTYTRHIGRRLRTAWPVAVVQPGATRGQ